MLDSVVIAITGYKGHGKDSLAKLIVQHGSVPWYITHFAAPLKRMSKEVFGLSEYQLHDPVGKETSLSSPVEMDLFIEQMSACTSLNILPAGKVATSPRQILQFFGTDYVRAVCNSYWFDMLSKDIEGHPRVVVPDLRFQNEADFVRRSLHGKIVKVVRTDMIPPEEGMHQSEQEIATIIPDLLLGTVTGIFSVQEVVAKLIGTDQFEKATEYDLRHTFS